MLGKVESISFERGEGALNSKMTIEILSVGEAINAVEEIKGGSGSKCCREGRGSPPLTKVKSLCLIKLNFFHILKVIAFMSLGMYPNDN